VHTSTAFWTTTLVILGIGHGLTLSTQNFASQAICKPREEASAAAMYAFLRSFGMALGVGIGGSIFQNVMKAKLIKLHLPVPIALNSEAYTVILRTLPNGPFKAQVLEAYASGFRGVYIGFCGISALALLVSLFIKHYDMNKVLESEHKLQDHRLSKILQLVGTPSETPTGANTPPAVAERMADSRAESHQEIEKL
jgi:hypothetical protein